MRHPQSSRLNIDAMNWAANAPASNAKHQAVLYSLAYMADLDGFSAPNLAVLADLASAEKGSVKKSLEGLETEGFIINTGKKNAGAGNAVIWQLRGV